MSTALLLIVNSMMNNGWFVFWTHLTILAVGKILLLSTALHLHFVCLMKAKDGRRHAWRNFSFSGHLIRLTECYTLIQNKKYLIWKSNNVKSKPFGIRATGLTDWWKMFHHSGRMDSKSIHSTIDGPPGVPGVSKNQIFFFTNKTVEFLR